MSVTPAKVVRPRGHQRLSHEEVLSRSFNSISNALVMNGDRAQPQYGTHSLAYTDVAPAVGVMNAELHGRVSLYLKPDAIAPDKTEITIEAKTQLGDWVIIYYNASLDDLTEVRVETGYRTLRVTALASHGNSTGTVHLGGE